MTFLTKENLVFGGRPVYIGKYKKPSTCPYCKIGTDATISGFSRLPYLHVYRVLDML